jgi:hypothetical protein
LTNFHKIDIFQSGTNRVAVQIFLRFQETHWPSGSGNANKIDLTPFSLLPFSRLNPGLGCRTSRFYLRHDDTCIIIWIYDYIENWVWKMLENYSG